MTIRKVTLTVPASPGSGSSQDAGALASDRTATFTSTTSDAVVAVEGSGDNTNFVEIPGTHCVGSATVNFRSSHRYVRPKRKGGSGGTQTLVIEAAPVDPAAAQPGTMEILKGPESNATDTLGRSPIGQVNGPRRVRDVSLNFGSNVTGHASNNATITVEAYDAGGNLLGTVATYTTTASSTALNDVAATLGAYVDLPDGTWLTYKVEKGGTGVQLPLFSGSIRFE